MITSRLVNVSRTALVASRGYGSATGGLPQVRVSFPEKVAHGLAIFFGVLAYPAWVISHMREYKGQH